MIRGENSYSSIDFPSRTVFSLDRSKNSIKISLDRVRSVIGRPKAELEIARLRNPILTGRHKQCDYLALAQMAKRALKQVNGVLLQARRGAIWKSVRQKM